MQNVDLRRGKIDILYIVITIASLTIDSLANVRYILHVKYYTYPINVKSYKGENVSPKFIRF